MGEAQMKRIPLKTIIIFVLIALFIIVIPATSSDYTMTVVNSALIYLMVTLGISMLMGMGGQMTFAPIAFMGLGAGFSAVLSRTFGVPAWLSIILSSIGVLIVAYLMGLVLFRLSGAYFTFATIGLVQIFSCIFNNWEPLMGAMNGVSGIPKLTLFGFTFDSLKKWFFLLAFCALVIALVVEQIRRTSFGRSLESVRDDETAALTLGVNVYRTKVLAMAVSSMFAGFAGAMLAHHNGAVSYSLFTFITATRFIIMIMLGGVNSTFGTAVGTILVTMLPEWLRPLQQYLNIIFGAIVILLMVFMPMGLAGLADHWWEKLFGRNRKTTVS